MLPYLEGCARRGHDITVLSCDKPDRLAQDAEQIVELCVASGIEWRPLPYHKRPPVLSSIVDSWALTRAASALHRTRAFDLVHCRSYIPGIAGLSLKRRAGVRLLFDMRGFWPEEKTEGGSWRLSNPMFRLVYGYFKRLEAKLLSQSDHVVSLTAAARNQLLTRPEMGRGEARTSIIPCSVDFDHFPPADRLRRGARARLGIDADARVLTYLGSLGGNYMLGEMLDFFRCYRASHGAATFLFVTTEPPAAIISAADARGIALDNIVVTPASREDVPKLVAAGDDGVAFKQPSFSALACSPTKLGEMLAMGIPVVANAGVGDVESVLLETGAGAIVHEFSEPSYAAAVDQLEAFRKKPHDIRASARRLFDLEAAIESYDRIYRVLAEDGWHAGAMQLTDLGGSTVQ